MGTIGNKNKELSRRLGREREREREERLEERFDWNSTEANGFASN